ncbi:PadR family transcriptional regulator [Flavobacteriaceae bacterium]|nr:PadR family transcriptional regulator [Flavobacteriaceae bacterium]
MSTNNFNTQIRKGLIEFCVLQIISRGKVYTTDIIEELHKSKIIVVEGTLYPLLNRLKSSNYVEYLWQETSQGPPRKYYTLTKEGSDHLKDLNVSWVELDKAVNKIIKTKK